MEIVAGIIVLIAALIGVAATLLTLSGAWLIVIVAGACWIWQPELYGWPVFAVAVSLALVGEIFEMISSAVGVKKLGGGRAGAIISMFGALAGGIAGSFVVPIVGTIVGAVLGAALGAIVGERGVAGKTWARSGKIAAGAAAGRAVAMVVKSVLTALCGLILTIAAFV